VGYRKGGEGEREVKAGGGEEEEGRVLGLCAHIYYFYFHNCYIKLQY